MLGRLPHWTHIGAGLLVVVIVFALQSHNIGFENGHHGWPSVHGLAIFSHVSPESRFVGHAQVFVQEDGSLEYDYFDRYPLPLGVFMRPFFAISDDLPTEIMIFRYVMNTFFLLTMFAAYRLVRLFVDDAALAFGITLMAFSSFYLTYYKDQIHYDVPAMLGLVWLLVTIGRHKLGRGRGWHVYAVTVAAVSMGRGYASLFVLGVWFLTEALTGLFIAWRALPLRWRLRQVFRTEAFYAMLLGVGVAVLWLGYNVYAEMALRDVSLMETSIFSSARRRLPFFNNALDGTETLSETGWRGWGAFLLVQFQRTVLWFAPLRLGGEMGWRFIPGEYAVEFNVWRFGAAVLLYGYVIVMIARLPRPRREIAIVSAFGGLAWAFFMINLTSKHIYVSMYSLGLTLMAWVGLLRPFVGRRYLTAALVVVSVGLFTASNWQARAVLTQQSRTLEAYTWDFNRIHERLPDDDGAVYLAYGYYRPWCIVNNNQCYVLGYYLSDHHLTRYYDAARYVLAPRPFYTAPQYASAGQTVDLLTPIRPENEVVYLMDKAAAQPRTAPLQDAPLFRFGEDVTLQAWSLVGDVNVSACGAVTVESWWLAPDVPAQNLNMQIVMVDANGGAVTESNAPLGLAPTKLWQPGTFTMDVRPLTVPCDTPPGAYPLIMGVYDPDTLQPQPVTDADGGAVGNQIYLTTLFVE